MQAGSAVASQRHRHVDARSNNQRQVCLPIVAETVASEGERECEGRNGTESAKAQGIAVSQSMFHDFVLARPSMSGVVNFHG